VAKVPRQVHHHFKAGQSRRRLLAVLIITAALFAVVVGRVIMLQTTSAQSLREAGREQRTTERILKADRGVIFDRNGDELALSIPATTIIANPKLVTDPAGTVATLAQLIPLSAEKQQALLEAFTSKDKSFVYIARQVDDGTAAAVMALALNGIDDIAEDRRTMPGGDVGQSVIGLTNIDGEGIAGLEMQYDDVLTGSDGELTREHDRDGRSLPGSETTTLTPVPGDDVVLTLDRSVQFAVEQAMLTRVSDLGARGGTAVVLDSNNGDVIAMVGVRRNDDGIVEVTSGNIAVVDAAEPGSVVKAITVAAALNEGTVTPDSMFEIPWQKKYSDTTLHDAEQHPTETWPVSKILTKSSNIGTVEVMLSIADTLRHKKEKLGSYMTAFGLGHKTALDFPGESLGLGADWTMWEGSEQYTVAFGQGIASTSIQLAAAINVLANDGMYVAPKLVSSTIGRDGTLTESAPSETHQVVRPEVAQQMIAIMRDVVCEGTAKLAQVDGVSVAGKTGTGLKAQANGTYLNEDGERAYYSSFVGFFPAEDPKVTVLISIDEPPGAEEEVTRFGGTAAAPVFATIAPTIMREMNIVPPVGGGCPKG
jgi:cell division protein FtsI (penicillin-binding protein 3)